ncbi:hypothetical protein AB6A40_001705 [Gnathostoma spinigerum]|uniref:TIL domain-containing protein n=1 Tax=Gnathostoma spinigerum TaxID=75299 RepID=A0ABD6EC81_9BILA
MYLGAIIGAVLSLTVISAIRPPRCGRNEKWTTCTGCELECGEDPNKPCTFDCKPPSCFCGPPFRRSPDGRCIPEWQCPAKPNRRCGPNEQWTECTGCEIRCGESPNKPCTFDCKPPSCFCGPPFRRAPNGRCVRPHMCPPFGK